MTQTAPQPKLVTLDRSVSRERLSDFALIKTVNDAFDLGVTVDLDRLPHEIENLRFALQNPGLWDENELLHMAIAAPGLDDLKAPKMDRYRPEFPTRAEMWRRQGYADIAEVLEEWYALAGEVEIEMENAGAEDEYPSIANSTEIRAKIKALDRKLGPLIEDVAFTAADIPEIIAEEFNLDPQPPHLFRAYWIDRILKSPGFASYSVDDSDGGWYLNGTPFGWLTKRHGAALQKHGYTYKFSFWAEEVGDTRGHLYIQTDRGPLILSDSTDSTSLKSKFPVQVSDIKGKKLFKLKEGDVPDALWNTGPGSKKGVSARVAAGENDSLLDRILHRLFGKK